MKTTKMLTVLVLALALILCQAKVSEAAEMGTAFTYQGHLYDNNDVANGLYDFQFSLYDINVGGAAVANDVNVHDMDVIDGYFTVELDFGGAVFDGNAVWLEIGIRPGDQNGPNAYPPLSPRQEVTPVPYALHTRGIFVDEAGNVGISTTQPTEKLHVNGDIKVNNIRMNSSDITDNGSIRIIIDEDNDQTDQTFSVWKDGAGGTELLRVQENGSVGIGVINPLTKLDVETIFGVAVRGLATATGDTENYGGYFAADGNVGRGVYGLTTGDWGRGVYGKAMGSSGRGVKGEAAGDWGRGVVGSATALGNVQNYGGYFEAAADWGRGVYGKATSSGSVENYGGYFVAASEVGRGVYGSATTTGAFENYGGYFEAAADFGRGVYGEAMGNSGRGVSGFASGTGLTSNYGGHFTAAAGLGRGVYGTATATGAGLMNYGGYFTAAGGAGRGVYGEASGAAGRGVYGKATAGGSVENYGGWFEAAGEDGRGVYGLATAVSGNVENYGGYFEAAGVEGRGVYGKATATGDFENYGGRFEAAGDRGHGVHGYVNVNSGQAVAIYGEAVQPNSQAGYFDGRVRITGNLVVAGSVSKGGGSFIIDHPLDPENRYLQHSFVESPDMMNVYNGNVLLDEKGQASVELPEYFGALNRDFRYQLTCIGGFAPVYIAEKISEGRFRIAGGTPGMEVSWQVTGIRQDRYAVEHRIEVEQEKIAEERGYYLHPEAYGLPKEKSIEFARNGRLCETRQVAMKGGEL